MKQAWTAALLLGVVMAAGAQQAKSVPTPTIYVEVNDGRLAVSPAGQRTAAGQTVLTWWLRTAGYRFAGIDFGSAGGYFSCAQLNDGQGVRCTKSADAPQGEIAYSIRVRSSSALTESDPGIFIVNE
jgi:hypothetical protein